MIIEPKLSIPPPSSFALELMPGINANLIRERAGDVEYLISFFDMIQRQKHRAEMLADVYFQQMQVLHKLLQAERTGDRPPPRMAKPLVAENMVKKTPPLPHSRTVRGRADVEIEI